MRVAIVLRVVLCLCLLASFAPAQDQGQTIRIFDRASVAVARGWKEGPRTATSVELLVPPSRKTAEAPPAEVNPKPSEVISADAGMLITIEVRRDHAEALRRLAEIASEQTEPVSLGVIDGWPSLTRRYLAPMPQPGGEEMEGGPLMTWFATTAVVIGNDLIRFETMLAPKADPKLLEQAQEIAHSLRAPGGKRELAMRDLEQIRGKLLPSQTNPARDGSEPCEPGRPKRDGDAAGTAVRVQSGVGELEVATSDDGSHVVVAANSGFSFSDDFGATWTSGGGTPCTAALCDGDPSLAVGESGAIYYSWIGGPAITQLGDGISRSTDNGHTFGFRAMAVTCPGASNCQVADQEHIAADRDNAGTLGDMVYNVWRNFPVSGGGAFSIRLVCSRDGGATWGAHTVIGAGDFPRVRVGGDGFVYVSWASGGNMMLHKYSDCDAGLTPQAGFPVTVSAFTNVACPVPGLDRCNGRNILSSPVVAVDDLDPTHVYYTFATSTGAGNEDVMVLDSSDGGLTFPRSVRVNSAVTGRRFMPWVSSYGGVAVVSWYDRRSATAAANDRTRFYIGSAAVKGDSLVAGTELDLSGTDDPECALWPCATNAVTDSESCSAQPQLAGRCFVSVSPTATGSGTPCDFSTPACPAGETCFNDRGCPKFGDYNGNAARAGRHYSAWSSATAPAGVGGVPAGINVYTSTDLIPSDFFVRDWTTNASNHDGGEQPSTHANFWSTSDVWNQSTSTAAAFPASDWILGDPPSRTGSNYVFARVSRRAPAASTAPSAMATVDFLAADFGLGTMFSSVGTETVTFAAGDTTRVTAGHSWPVAATASAHLCLAAQISAPQDAYDTPSLVTTAPGPGDPLVLADNNKAQRNLAGGESGWAEIHAVIRNATKKWRPMEIGIHWPPDVRVRGRVSIVGGKSIELGRTRDGRIALGRLGPGEARWLRFDVLPQDDRPVSVDFFDIAGAEEAPSNGFSIQVAKAPIELVAARNLRAMADVLARLAVLEQSPQAVRESKAALKAAGEGKIEVEAYLDYLRTRAEELAAVVASHLSSDRCEDTFEIRAAVKMLEAAVRAKDAAAASAAQNALTERLDAHLTSMVRRGML